MATQQPASDEPTEEELFDGQRYYNAEEMYAEGTEFPSEYVGEEEWSLYPDGIETVRVVEAYEIEPTPGCDNGDYGYTLEMLDADGDVVATRPDIGGHRVHYNVKYNDGAFGLIQRA